MEKINFFFSSFFSFLYFFLFLLFSFMFNYLYLLFGKFLIYTWKLTIFILESFFSNIEQIAKTIILSVLLRTSIEMVNNGFNYSITAISLIVSVLLIVYISWFVTWHILLKHLDFVQEFVGNKQINTKKYTVYRFKKMKK